MMSLSWACNDVILDFVVAVNFFEILRKIFFKVNEIFLHFTFWTKSKIVVFGTPTVISTGCSVPSLMGCQGGFAPITAACAPQFCSRKIVFLEHHAARRQPTTFKLNSHLSFSRFFTKLLVINCCT